MQFGQIQYNESWTNTIHLNLDNTMQCKLDKYNTLKIDKYNTMQFRQIQYNAI